MYIYIHNGYIHYSLLDIISGRKVKGGVTGDVVINNEFIPENFRCASGYVTQVHELSAINAFCYYTYNNIIIMCVHRKKLLQGL